MPNFQIDPEFQSMIPPMTDEEYRQLESNLISDGCRDPLVVWNGTIVDGHNRYKICTEHGIEFKTVEKDFPDRAAVIEWIILNQFGRRNLSPGNRSLLALKLENVFKEKAKENMSAGGGDKKSGKQNSATPIATVETREELAKIAGVSHDTIDKVKRIIAEGTPEQLERIKRGDKGNSVRAVYNEIFGKDKPSQPSPELVQAADPPENEAGDSFRKDQYTTKPEVETEPDPPEAPVDAAEERRRERETFKQTVQDLKTDRDTSYTPEIFFMEYEQFVQEITAKMEWYKMDIFAKLYPLLSAADIIELAECNHRMIDAIESLDQYQKTQAMVERK